MLMFPIQSFSHPKLKGKFEALRSMHATSWHESQREGSSQTHGYTYIVKEPNTYLHMWEALPQMKSFLSAEETSVREELGFFFFFTAWGLKLYHEYLKEIYPAFLPNHYFNWKIAWQHEFIKFSEDVFS